MIHGIKSMLIQTFQNVLYMADFFNSNAMILATRQSIWKLITHVLRTTKNYRPLHYSLVQL